MENQVELIGISVYAIGVIVWMVIFNWRSKPLPDNPPAEIQSDVNELRIMLPFIWPIITCLLPFFFYDEWRYARKNKKP